MNLLLPKKANLQDIQDLETLNNEKFFEVEKHMLLLATKEDISKRFNNNSRRLREMVDMIKNKEAQIDEGMMTRKNLGPMACASCQKNLVNLEGKPVDYTVWKGMPQSVNNERLAKYG